MTPPPAAAAPGPANDSAPEPPFLSLHTTVVLLAALVVGLLTGTLSWWAGSPVAGAVLAGLAGAGSSVPALRSLIGRLP